MKNPLLKPLPTGTPSSGTARIPGECTRKRKHTLGLGLKGVASGTPAHATTLIHLKKIFHYTNKLRCVYTSLVWEGAFVVTLLAIIVKCSVANYLIFIIKYSDSTNFS